MMHWHVPMQHKKWVCSGLLLLALLIIGAPCVTGCADTVEKAVIGVIVVTHGAPISQWNDTVRGMKHQIKSPYSVEPAFLDFDEERALAKAVRRLEDKGANEILIVHVSPSSYSSHHEEVRYLAGLRKDSGFYTA